jgi:transcription elongation factor Elf1
MLAQTTSEATNCYSCILRYKKAITGYIARIQKWIDANKEDSTESEEEEEKKEESEEE